MSNPITFTNTIKPYFTPCYRAHMMMYGNRFDLWDAKAVQTEWDMIHTKVKSGDMPAPGCPEGVWDDMTQERFLIDFTAWKAAGYPS
ncbi:hypothetical protein JJE66_13860 [Bradyrhizobium diazoefficiens]|uniref:hypothetical protein n=1 Tax=Bradyrhizobium diazoefficiens TaxID=1355477 RepID=UPI001909C7CB|nr:hypothetical protein [Bradyrhizobium diazoefficiens]MBK3662330.1 hypothetical protein [Bradyrhizobium diazoefficiens]